MQIKAMADGRVEEIPTFQASSRATEGMEAEDYSKMSIKHGEYKVIYVNISNQNKYVEEGEEVIQGQVVCETNNFRDFYIEMYKGQEKVNPDRYLEEDLLPHFSHNMGRRYWEENVIAYGRQDFNDRYFKSFETGNTSIQVHESLYSILKEIKEDSFSSWHPDEIIVLGNPNIYDTDNFNVKNITTHQEKVIQSGVGILITFDKDNNKGTEVNKYIRELIDLLNMNGVMSIIIYNEGVYFDIGPKNLVNNNDNIEDAFDKLPEEIRNEREEDKEVEGSDYSNDEDREKVEWLARVINGEARGEIFKGQVAVGAVVLNRVKHRDYPHNIKDVIHQEGQFDAVNEGQTNLTPGEEQFRAARQALAGVDPTDGAIYYYNPETSTDESFIEYMESLDHRIEIGNHIFARP